MSPVIIKVEQSPREVLYIVRVNGKAVAQANTPFTAGVYADAIENTLKTLNIPCERR